MGSCVQSKDKLDLKLKFEQNLSHNGRNWNKG